MDPLFDVVSLLVSVILRKKIKIIFFSEEDYSILLWWRDLWGIIILYLCLEKITESVLSGFVSDLVVDLMIDDRCDRISQEKCVFVRTPASFSNFVCSVVSMDVHYFCNCITVVWY